MSKILKPALLIDMIGSVVLGVILLIMPGRFLQWLGWYPIDAIISRILGAALLAIAWGDFRIWRGGTKAEVKLLVEMQLGFSALAGIGVLRHLVARPQPLMVWLLFVIFVLLALIWLVIWMRERQ